MRFSSQRASVAVLLSTLLVGSVLSGTVPSDKEKADGDKEVEVTKELSDKKELDVKAETAKPVAARPAPQADKNPAAFNKGGRQRASGRLRQGQGSNVGRNQRQQANGRGGRRVKAGRQVSVSTAAYPNYYGDYGAVTINNRRKNKRGKKRKHGPFETSEEWKTNRGDYGNYNYGG